MKGFLYDIKKNECWIGFISIIASICACVFYFSQFDEEAFHLFFSSDSLYLPSIYKDLFLDEGSFCGWHFNYAPNFFPDMLFYFLLMFFTGGNFIVSSFLFAVIQFYFILFVVFKLFKTFEPGLTFNGFSLPILLFSLMPLTYIIDNDFYISFMAFTNSYHTGAFLMSLVSILLVLNYLKNPKWLFLILFFIVSVIAIPCDKLYLILFTAPAMCCFIILLILKYKKKYILLLLLSSVLAVITGLVIFDKFTDDTCFFLSRAYRYMSFENIHSSWKVFAYQTITYISEFSIKQLFLIISLLPFPVLLFQTLYKTIQIFKKNASVDLKYVYFLFSTFAIPIIILGPIINGSYGGWDCIRYSIFGFFLSLFNLILLFYDKKRFAIASNIISGCLVVGLCLTCIIGSKRQSPARGLKNFFAYYPKEARELDSLSRVLNIQYGITNDYWRAKRLTMFSKCDVRLYSAHDEGTPYSHVTNEYWFLGKKEGRFSHPDFRFLYWIESTPLPGIIAGDSIKVIQQFPLREEMYTVFVVEPFSYKKAEYKLH